MLLERFELEEETIDLSHFILMDSPRQKPFFHSMPEAFGFKSRKPSIDLFTLHSIKRSLQLELRMTDLRTNV